MRKTANRAGAWLLWRLAMLAAAMPAVLMPALADSIYPAPGTYVLQRIMRFPDWPVVDSAGNDARLQGVTRNAITLLAFFYAACRDPNGCPVAWSTFEQVYADGGKDAALAGRLRLVFVSLDPELDKPAAMNVLEAPYRGQGGLPWRFFTSRSLTGLSPLLERVGQDVSIEVDASGQRAVNHMLKVFLIDRDGWVREIYTTAFLKPEVVENDIRTLVMEQPEATNATPPPPPFLQRVRSWLGLAPR